MRRRLTWFSLQKRFGIRTERHKLPGTRPKPAPRPSCHRTKKSPGMVLGLVHKRQLAMTPARPVLGNVWGRFVTLGLVVDLVPASNVGAAVWSSVCLLLL